MMLHRRRLPRGGDAPAPERHGARQAAGLHRNAELQRLSLAPPRPARAHLSLRPHGVRARGGAAPHGGDGFLGQPRASASI